MTDKSKSTQNNTSVKEYIVSLNDEQTAKDSHVLIKMMQHISGHKPKLWNVGTIGFDTYHYKYDSGREGDSLIIGFYPRKGKITVYLMDGTARYSGLLAKLGLYLYKLDFYLFGTSRSNVYGMGTNGILHRLCVARRRFVFINYGGRFRDQHIIPPSFLFYFCFW